MICTGVVAMLVEADQWLSPLPIVGSLPSLQFVTDRDRPDRRRGGDLGSLDRGLSAPSFYSVLSRFSLADTSVTGTSCSREAVLLCYLICPFGASQRHQPVFHTVLVRLKSQSRRPPLPLATAARSLLPASRWVSVLVPMVGVTCVRCFARMTCGITTPQHTS